MKKFYFTSLILSFLLFSFTTLVKKDYVADVKNSKINWKGSKPTGSHYGTINLSKGKFTVASDKIIGGEFTIDMNSIVDLDMAADNEYNAKLVNHLKSADFFDAAKFPTGTYKITGSEPKNGKTLILGELTLKENTHPVSFLAEVKIDKKGLSLKSETFKVDRSKYDVRFKSKSFFADLKDKFIDDDMEISVEVIANK